MRNYQEGKRAFLTFDSVPDVVETFEETPGSNERWSERVAVNPEWYGGIRSLRGVLAAARKGLVDKVPDAMRIAEAAVENVEREHDMPAFSSFYDVSGADVDVARYLTGEPECMINYQMVSTPRAGRVITLRSSIAASSGIDADDMVKRGIQVVALILALEKIGLQVELWADALVHDTPPGGTPTYVADMSVKVKGGGDQLDVGQIMFAFAQPAMFRVLMLGVMHQLPERWQSEIGVEFGYGFPGTRPSGLQDGEYYLPPPKYGEDNSTLVVDTLKALELIP